MQFDQKSYKIFMQQLVEASDAEGYLSIEKFRQILDANQVDADALLIEYEFDSIHLKDALVLIHEEELKAETIIDCRSDGPQDIQNTNCTVHIYSCKEFVVNKAPSESD